MTMEGITAILMAPFVGSFLGVVIDRWPEGRPILIGRSQCDNCHRTLGAIELIPFISYVLLGRRCRTCGGALSVFYPLIEMGAMVIAAGVALTMTGWLLWFSLYLGWSLLVLAVIDAREMILPDPINLPLVPAGLAAAWLHSPDSLNAHLLGAMIGFSSLAAIAWIYRHVRQREGLGFGDAKLLAAAGAWLGWAALPGLLFVAALTALAVTAVRLRLRGGLVATAEIAFGPYLAFSFWVSWLFGPVILG